MGTIVREDYNTLNKSSSNEYVTKTKTQTCFNPHYLDTFKNSTLKKRQKLAYLSNRFETSIQHTNHTHLNYILTQFEKKREYLKQELSLLAITKTKVSTHSKSKSLEQTLTKMFYHKSKIYDEFDQAT